ncbi:MAG: peptidylprolyl isomerase [Ignavibacteriae bacterium]|nr:peptidylprolyl isomerase [Ignavibacteriota bacterium]
MNIKHYLIFIGLLGTLLIIGCGEKEDPVVLEIGAKKIGLGEYENFFAKNTGGWDAAKKSLLEDREKFLDLLTNYKLKLLDAYDRGFDKDPEIQAELKEYRSSLAASYLVEREVTERGVRNMYDRRKEEIRAQHILLSMKPTATPEETLALYNKAKEIIAQLQGGAPFDTLVMQYSEDQTAKQNFGDVYYFTAGQLASSFEASTYSMKKGQMTQTPVRSSSGYHIIKVLDRKQTPYQIKVRHIMARFTNANDSTDTTNALARVKGLQDSLKNGWKFADLAVKLSEDAGSAPEGGDLGWFERRRWVQPFDEAAFTLKAGQTSGVVKTPFGFHLIHCDSVKELPPFAEIKEEFKKRYQQYRFNEEYEQYIQGLKTKYNYTFNEETFQSFFSALDSNQSVDDSGWSEAVPKEVLAKSLFTLDNKQVIVDTIVSMFNRKMEFRSTMLRPAELRQKIGHLVEGFVLDEKSTGLEAAHPEFASLMKEYEDGIILFKAEQQEVWNKVSVNDSALKDYYSKNKERFKFPNRVSYSEIEVESDTLALMLYDSLTKGADFGELAERHNNDPELKAKKGAHEMEPVTQDDFTKLADSMQVGEISEPIELMMGGFIIMKVTKKEAERIKTYEEAGAELSNTFQEYESKRLEKIWLDRIKERYPVKQFKEQLGKAFSSAPPNS